MLCRFKKFVAKESLGHSNNFNHFLISKRKFRTVFCFQTSRVGTTKFKTFKFTNDGLDESPLAIVSVLVRFRVTAVIRIACFSLSVVVSSRRLKGLNDGDSNVKISRLELLKLLKFQVEMLPIWSAIVAITANCSMTYIFEKEAGKIIRKKLLKRIFVSKIVLKIWGKI